MSTPRTAREHLEAIVDAYQKIHEAGGHETAILDNIYGPLMEATHFLRHAPYNPPTPPTIPEGILEFCRLADVRLPHVPSGMPGYGMHSSDFRADEIRDMRAALTSLYRKQAAPQPPCPDLRKPLTDAQIDVRLAPLYQWRKRGELWEALDEKGRVAYTQLDAPKFVGYGLSRESSLGILRLDEYGDPLPALKPQPLTDDEVSTLRAMIDAQKGAK